MSADVFPATRMTWIAGQLDQGPSGRLSVNHYLMNTYLWPLKVYYLGTNSRWLGDPDDVIDGFFASRLGHGDFFEKWQSSGLRLRHWLVNAFCFYLMELRRQRRKQRPAGDAVDDQVTFSGDPDLAVDRAAVVSFVRQAMEQAQQTCFAEGLELHWQAFVRHHIDGLEFSAIAKELNLGPARAAVMSRTATRKFRSALHEVLVRDGAAPDQVDQEIQSLLKGVES